VYTSGDSQITGRVTVPLLFDSQTNTCISSESADCVKILLERFSSLHYQEPSAAGNLHHIDNENGGERINFYPNAKKDQIDQEMIYMSQNITSIVYGIHFANTQQLFDAKCHQFFETLFKYEKILTNTEIGFFKMKVPQAFLISYYLRLWYVLMLRTDQGFE
jgi:putative glutathione S-transferase